VTDISDTRSFRRKVLYIPGYDPFPPRRYRELYRREGAAQAKISGFELKQGPKIGEGADWSAEAVIEGRRTLVEFEVLTWSDLVQDSMKASILMTYVALVRTAWIYLKSGAFGRLMILRRGPVLAALYPIAVLLGQLLVAVVLGSVAGHVVGWLGVPYLHWLGFLPVFAGVLVTFRRQDSRFFAYYLMLDYAWTCQADGAYPPDLQDRIAEFRRKIEAALASDVDEVLVVGHSSGAILAVSALAPLAELPPRPVLSLLTLGEVIPMMSFLPAAQELRRDLNTMAKREDIFWCDVTAPGDACSFALVDPVAVTGVKPRTQKAPLVLSAAFRQSLSDDRWRALRWRFFRMHFQYLCAFDRPGVFDYFRVTAGSQTLRERLGHVAPSPSRIDVVASKYTDMAP
jgi:hypothetical protein